MSAGWTRGPEGEHVLRATINGAVLGYAVEVGDDGLSVAARLPGYIEPLPVAQTLGEAMDAILAAHAEREARHG